MGRLGRVQRAAAAPPIDGATGRRTLSGGGPPGPQARCWPASRPRPGSPSGIFAISATRLARPPNARRRSPIASGNAWPDGLSAARQAIEHDREIVADRAGRAEADIFDAHLALLDDEAMLDPAHQAIGSAPPPSAPGMTPPSSWPSATARSTSRCCASAPPDVLDVGRRVIRALTGEQSPGPDRGGIVVAGELTPADAAALDPARVLGIATAHGTATAHAAILARALGLPAVVGLGEIVLGIEDGTDALLDGEAGTLQVQPPAEVVREAERRRTRLQQRREAARARAPRARSHP